VWLTGLPGFGLPKTIADFCKDNGVPAHLQSVREVHRMVAGAAGVLTATDGAQVMAVSKFQAVLA